MTRVSIYEATDHNLECLRVFQVGGTVTFVLPSQSGYGGEGQE